MKNKQMQPQIRIPPYPSLAKAMRIKIKKTRHTNKNTTRRPLWKIQENAQTPTATGSIPTFTKKRKPRRLRTRSGSKACTIKQISPFRTTAHFLREEVIP